MADENTQQNDLLKQIAKNTSPQKGTGVNSADGLRATKEQITATQTQTKATKDSAESMGLAEKSARIFEAGLLDSTKAVSSNVDTWRKLTATGSNFNNDLARLNISAAQTGLGLDEFAGIISENGKNLAGLGGSVSKGTENFSKFSNAFFSNKAAVDELTDLGLTTKEMNEALVTQISNSRVLNLQDSEATRRQIEATVRFNRELDLTTKVTGENRKQLVAEMLEKSQQARLQARFNLIEQQLGHDAAEKARNDYETAFVQMEAAYVGSGKYLAEKVISDGAILSDAVAETQSALGPLAPIIDKTAMAINRGQSDVIAQFTQSAKVAGAKLSLDPTTNQMVILGKYGNSLTKTIAENAQENMTLVASIKSVAAQHNILLKTEEDFAKAIKIRDEEISRSQKGIVTNDKGKDVDASGALRALQEAEIAKNRLKTAPMAALDTVTFDGKTGYEHLNEHFTKTAEAVKALPDDLHKTFVEVAQDISNAISTGIKDITSFSVSDVMNLFVDGQKVGGRATGSIGSTGKIIENFGKGTLTMLHGNEGVITENQLSNLAKGLQSSGVESTIHAMMKTISDHGMDETTGASTGETGKVIPSIPNDFINTISKNINNISQSVIGLSTQNSDTVDSNEDFLDYYDEMLKKLSTENSGQIEGVKSLVSKMSGVVNDNIQTATSKTPKIKPLNFNDLKTEVQDQHNQVKNQVQPKQDPIERQTVHQTATPPHQEGDMFKEMVKQLQTLNKQMGQLLVQHNDLGKKQVKATKSNSQNLFDH